MGNPAVNDAMEQLEDALDRATEEFLDEVRSLMEAQGASPSEIEDALRECQELSAKRCAEVMLKARRLAEHPDVASPETH
jgi:hypothetical protein